MKNLLYLIDKLEDLPVDTLSYDINKKHYATLRKLNWDRARYEKHPIQNIWPETRALWIIHKNIGKSFDGAFTYYCKQVPKYQQFIFEDYFRDNRGNPDFIIDEDGNIQIYSAFANRTRWGSKNRNLTFFSDDFKQEFKHKITSKVENPENIKYNGTGKYTDRCSHKGCDHHACSHRMHDYEWITVKGWSKTFDRWSDPEFKKLRIKQHWDFVNRQRDKKKSSGASFQTLIEMFPDKRKENLEWTQRQEENRLRVERWNQEKIRKAEEANLIKIISHGFDPVNSFRHKLK